MTAPLPRAVRADELGPPENYRLVEHDPGPPSPTQVRISIRAAGISFVDVLTAGGGYQVKPPVPFIPGSECAGVVEAVGAEVTGLAVGDKVVASGWGGMFAEAVNLPARVVRKMPAALTFEEAAVFPVSYATAWHALVDRGQLKAGETLLVLGAGGATGYAAVQIGKLLGAHVIGSASDAAKRTLATAGGADAVVDARGGDWREAVKAANAGKGVDVVFDPVGGDATDPAFRSLAWNGRHLVVGFPAGMTALKTNLPLLKGASLIGVDVRQFGIFEAEKSEANRDRIFALAGGGKLRPAVARTYPLEEFRAAMADAAAGKSAGRIVLVMD
ncbi:MULTISPECIES: NADPH:quinone oxidoreductase family protein [unclassified Sphingopyxis]|uniref:NADPH:quinone oxidoreductase family protein n=1 Tax=unclassified Sphingopyxis TaxID=2614943 RepID=UPI0007368927|nr:MULTISPECIES: NADPH:quinone oxidoreductase family protein [unclassified Sphingopyxis]KTE44957.1 zinc-binding alcohol dehydrogenase [Sphingopyxis sp. HIX]KTE74846.1 zinc-binding alcohol dehydrogenase [Sphingopyxis sp. HXXIV]